MYQLAKGITAAALVVSSVMTMADECGKSEDGEQIIYEVKADGPRQTAFVNASVNGKKIAGSDSGVSHLPHKYHSNGPADKVTVNVLSTPASADAGTVFTVIIYVPKKKTCSSKREISPKVYCEVIG